MSADTRSPTLGAYVPTYTETFMTQPGRVQRTPAEKARILARLTVALAAIKSAEGPTHGDA